MQVLRDEVPALVAAWAKTSSLDPVEKKGRLKGLFEDESERAEELATIFELFAGKFESMVASRVADRVLTEVRPKLEEIVRDSIVVEVPPPVISMPEPIAVPEKPDLESAQEDVDHPEAREPDEVPPPVEPVQEGVAEPEVAVPEPEPEPIEDDPEPEAVADEPEPAAADDPESEAVEEEVESEAEDEVEPEAVEEEAEPASEDEVEPEAEDEVEPAAEEEVEPEPVVEEPEPEGEGDENAVPGRISFDDIEGMIDNILDQTQ